VMTGGFLVGSVFPLNVFPPLGRRARSEPA